MSLSSPQTLKVYSPQTIFSIKGINKNMKGTEYTFQWTINEFGYIERDAFVSSPAIYLGKDNELEANLRVYPNGMEDSTDGYVSIFIHFSNMKITEQDKYNANVKFQLITAKNKEKKAAETIIESEAYTAEVGWGIKNFYPAIYTSSEEHDCWHEVDNFTQAVKIICTIIMVTDENNTETVDSKITKQDLLKSVASMYVDKLLTDVSFVIGEEKLPAHKVMLAARSEVFRAMFHSNMTEASSNIVIITDASVEAFKALLLFIYTGQVDSLDTLAEELLCLAEKYEITDLKDKCERSLVQRLSMENAIHVLVLADRFQAVRLKEQAYDFYSKGMKKL